MRDIIVTLLCAASSLFAIIGTIGLFRFPDTYARLQASSLAGTTAVFTVLLAAIVLSPDVGTAVRVLLIIVFFFLSNPTTTHIIARYAWKSGIDPWVPRKKP